MPAMLTLEEAQERLLALVRKPEIDVVETAQGRPTQYLARDLVARLTQPPADLSAMDGYAICGNGPWRRVGESRAGEPFSCALEPGQCTRISTGAHMPQGADRVLIQENASVDGDRVALADGEELPPPERHVRKQGFDFAAGETVLTQGSAMGPGPVALALSAGFGSVPVWRTPRVAILDSGDELALDPEQCGPDQIPASNGPMIAAMLRSHVGEVSRLGPVLDNHEALAQALAKADSCDILITSGGASVGDHDLVQEALARWGAGIDFWKVAIKPGKPLMVATRGNQVILGLPGNPVSSFVTAFLFALPLVRAAMGDPDPLPKSVRVSAAEDLPATGSRHEFLRGIQDGTSARLAASQDSSALRALAAANCLIDRPAGSPAIATGSPVQVYNLHNG
ncbi:molybdopterin molybdotransferase MoeA [Erythrobacter sp. GH1-10]|uniref:molybdopterin molybdotransferase MoeA n=1 Tax=Erythrobacter sp. GH1-10 TaxID=3349334 RepID=UPI0038779BCB